MEPAEAKVNYMQIFLGEYEVVDRKDSLGTVSIHLGNNVYITMHVLGLPVTAKPGTKLPLYTKLPYNPEPIDNALFGKPPVK